MPIMVQEVFTSRDFFEIYTQTKTKLPGLDLEKLSRNKRYFEAITYTLADLFQLEAWRNYQTLATELKAEVVKMLAVYGEDIPD